MKEYQKIRFRRFTAKELVKEKAIEALDDEVYKDEVGAAGPIHPLFEKGNWYVQRDLPRHFAFVPILGDFGGLWSVSFLFLIFVLF